MATSEEIRNWFAANPGASDAQIAAAMQANNVSSGEVASALGVDPGMVAQRYAAATAPAPTQPAAAPAPVTTPETWVPGASVGLLRSRQSGRSDADYYGSVAVAANKWLQNPGTAAEAFDAMVKSGISVNDLLNAGISQGTIDNAFMSPTSAVQKTVNATALNSMTSMLAQNPLITREIDQRGIQDIYKGARDYVAALQQGGLTDAERNKLREAATVQGWGFADIRAAGIDPTILFGAPKPVVPTPVTPTPVTPTPVTPTPVFPQPVPYTPVNVYQPLPQQPDIYAAGQPALDVAFRESAPRTAIPGMPGAYEYTPAAKLRPATGAGYTFTPPSVTSRPRSLLSPTLLSYVSPSQQFAQSRAAQDQALLGAFRQSGLPQNASNFYSWRNRLRSGEFGAGSAFDSTAFQSAFGSWAATQAPRTPAQGTAPVGDVTGYSEIAGRIQPIDLRTVPTFAEGGEASARELLDRLKKPEGTGEEVPGAVGQGLRNLPLERMNARRARAGMDPYAPARPAASMLENIIRGGAAIPGTVGRYAERVVGSEDPLAKLGGDITGVGGAMLQGLKEDPLGFAADVAPIIGEIRSAADVDKYSALANEAIAAGNPALAKVYQEIVAMSAAGAVPLAGMATRVGGRVGKRGLIDAAERAAKEAAEQAPTEARQMLEALAPETGQLPAEDVLSPAITRPVEPMPLTESEKMLSELDEIQADLPETVRPTITEEIGDRRRVGTTGRYVGAPEGINTPQKLAALTRSITNLTKEGEFGRFWYERSGRQILDITGGNVEDADKLVQAIAITSPNTPVGANFDYALQAYYQWKNGQPIRTGMYTTAMSDKLQRMFDGEEWAGRKTNNFYNNLMREIDPSKAQGVTTDIWMMRAFGFGKDAPTDAQYSFVENETKRIAKNLGWEPQQVQAAIWVALKSRMENPDVKRAVEEKSFENGWITYNDEGERVVLDQNKHAANWLEKAMQHTPTEADREAAKFDYADAAANNLAQISWESIPSRTSGHMPEIFEAAPEVVQDYHVQMSKAFLDDDGNDIIAKEFDILSPGDFEAPGYFEQRVSPGTQTNITAPRQYGVTRRIEAIKKQAAEEGWSKEQRDAAIRAATYATDPSAREAMYAYAAARGILLKQDGVGMHRPAFITGLSRPKANGIEVSIGRPLTARETAEIARLVAAEAGHTEYNPIGSPSGVRFINFDYLGTPNLDFQKTVNNALKKMNFDNDEAVDAKMFGADTGYLSNNWKENFNGEGYLESGELARRPDLQRKVRDLVTRLAPRVSAVEEEFANRYSWNRNTNLNRSYETQQAVGTPSGTVTPAPEIPELPATVRPFKRGGSVERMINDNRKYL